ncbi:MAG: carbon-nitrogen hydrolase family protein [Solirubrobacteraceae bacterium]
MRDFRGACVQTPPGGLITATYLDETLKAVPDPPDFVVLPELCVCPYFPLEPDSEDARTPLLLDGPEIGAFGSVAKKHRCHIMLGMYLREGKRRFNAAVLLGPGGSILEGRTSTDRQVRSFHKVHLCDNKIPGADFCESSYFEAGEEYVVWYTPVGCVGVIICYDRHFPEAWVTLREMGAEIICVCTAAGLEVEPSFVAEVQAMSLQQSVYALMANRVGVEALRTSARRTEFLGGSCITGPFGECLVAAPPRQHQAIITAELSAEHLESVRGFTLFHENRRPTTYLGR